LSLARADLEALSHLLRDRQSEAGFPSAPIGVPAEDAAQASIQPVDRVILYIDDLDRCKPTDVVRVLQLVHMLLAFELFVVVVAVDARWVGEALRQTYSWLGDDSQVSSPNAGGESVPFSPGPRVVTPQDYLEKIFQIAFWLEPMSVSGAASYLASLVRSPAREPDLGGGGTGQDLAPGADSSATGGLGKVEISSIELDYMRYLAAYVGSSSRRVKRLVNVYRLIKAGLSGNQLSAFVTERVSDDSARSGPYQIVIGLLVIGTGASGQSGHILAELAECDPGEKIDRLVDRLRARDHPEWTMAAQVVEAMMRSQKA
jgi:hypothetical protein